MSATATTAACSYCGEQATYARTAEDNGAIFAHACARCLAVENARDASALYVLAPVLAEAIGSLAEAGLTREQIRALVGHILEAGRDACHTVVAPWQRGVEHDDRYVRIDAA